MIQVKTLLLLPHWLPGKTFKTHCIKPYNSRESSGNRVHRQHRQRHLWTSPPRRLTILHLQQQHHPRITPLPHLKYPLHNRQASRCRLWDCLVIPLWQVPWPVKHPRLHPLLLDLVRPHLLCHHNQLQLLLQPLHLRRDFP